MKYFGQLWTYFRFVARRFVEDRCFMVAGSLTYTSLLALVPLFTVTLVLTSHFALIRDLILQVKAFVLKNLMPDVGVRVVTVYMDQFSQNAGQLTLIGLLIIAATALALMFTIDTAFNDIWRTRRRRAWWVRLAGFVTVLAAGPLLIGASLTLTSFLAHWSRRLDDVLPYLDDWLLNLVPFVLTTLALVIAYLVMPARHVPLRHAMAGGVFAGLLFEIVKHLFVVYILRVPTYSVVYGAFASAPIFLVWIFCCWMVVLAGAEVAATLSHFRQIHSRMGRRDMRAQTLRDAIALLDALAAHDAGLGMAALRLREPMPIDVAEDILHALADAGLVVADRRGRYRLGRGRESISENAVQAALFME